MVTVSVSLREDYWDTFELQEDDVEFLYNYLLEVETPLTPQELTTALVEDRIRREIRAIEEQRSSGGDIYFPEQNYEADQSLVFPALDWRRGRVLSLRPGRNPDLPEFQVMRVQMDNAE